MKTFAIVALAAPALSAAVPRIELNMAAMKKLNTAATDNSGARLEQHVTPIYHKHDGGSSGGPAYQPSGSEVTSVQDWTERCPVKTSTTENCPQPSAVAYDHHNGQLEVNERLFLIDQDNRDFVKVDGAKVQLPVECKAGSKACTKVDFQTRSTYLFKYDAMDKAGNHAEQVVFALIIDDTKAPVVNVDIYGCHEGTRCSPSTCQGAGLACAANKDDQDMCEHFGRTRPQWGCEWKQSTPGRDCFPKYQTQGWVEAASTWRMCPAMAIDTYDGDTDVVYSILDVDNNNWLVPKATPTTYAGAKNVIDTLTASTFRVTATATDKAGAYGAGGENNSASVTSTIVVKDTRSPWITVHGFGMMDEKTKYDTVTYPCDPKTHKWGCKVQGFPLECGTIYKKDCSADEVRNQGVAANVACEEGASLNDKLDDANLKTIFAKDSLAERPINIMETTDQEINFTGEDSHGNVAAPRVRMVSVRDTTKPVMELSPCPAGGCKHQAGFGAWTDPGAVCKDTCDPNPSMENADDEDLKDYPKWDRKFDDKVLGTYKRTYRCKDRSGHITESFRYVEVIDTTKPDITITPCAVAPEGGKSTDCLVEASLQDVYTEPGASCEDKRDGTIIMAPPKGIVKLNEVGDYTVTYTCKDSVGNEQTSVRAVKVVDTTAPVIHLKGKTVEYVEAGFPWSDPMVGCTEGCAMDNIDGDLSADIETADATVDVTSAFSKYRTCKEIKAGFPADMAVPTGWYTVSMKVGDEVQLKKVWCDMKHDGATYFGLKNAAPIKPYNVGVNGDCATVGMEIAKFPSKGAFQRVRNEFGADFFPGEIYAESTVEATQYICSTNQNTYSHSTEKLSVGDLTHAVPGEYKIHYMVKDHSQNKDKDWQAGARVSRDVIVRDTLPPVIVMSIGGKTHVSDSSVLGLNGVTNPAGAAATNPFISASSLMSEEATTSVNGWVIGAAASAVTGLALLAFSKNSAVVTSVPV
jgi:hypothetical protein